MKKRFNFFEQVLSHLVIFTYLTPNSAASSSYTQMQPEKPSENNRYQEHSLLTGSQHLATITKISLSHYVQP